jgi:uncharacterized protein YcbK (DUF882 family)
MAWDGQKASCLPPSIKAKLHHIEKHYGRVTVISAYRKNAVIAGTRKRSHHADCKAVDFHMHGNKRGADAWLMKQDGEFIRYSGKFHHWHVGVGHWKGFKR